MPELVETVRDMLVGQPKKIRGHEGRPCEGRRCIEIHHLGMTRQPTFKGDEPIWGPESVGSLFAEWDLHAEQYTRAWVHYPMPPWSPGLSVDVSEAL